jgi:hypothetical protein
LKGSEGFKWESLIVLAAPAEEANKQIPAPNESAYFIDLIIISPKLEN